MTLTEFLLARIAQEDAPRESLHDHATCALFRDKLSKDCTCGWPARALAEAEAEAKRRLIARHAQDGGAEPWMDADWLADMTAEERGGYCSWCTYDVRTVSYPCPDLRDLALPYADHDDYDESWRP